MKTPQEIADELWDEWHNFPPAPPSLVAALEAHAREAHREAIENAARVAERGHFLHDDAPAARFGKACAAAIRALLEQGAGMSAPKERPPLTEGEIRTFAEWAETARLASDLLRARELLRMVDTLEVNWQSAQEFNRWCAEVRAFLGRRSP